MPACRDRVFQRLPARCTQRHPSALAETGLARDTASADCEGRQTQPPVCRSVRPIPSRRSCCHRAGMRAGTAHALLHRGADLLVLRDKLLGRCEIVCTPFVQVGAYAERALHRGEKTIRKTGRAVVIPIRRVCHPRHHDLGCVGIGKTVLDEQAIERIGVVRGQTSSVRLITPRSMRPPPPAHDSISTFGCLERMSRRIL